MKREAKLRGGFYVDPEAKLLFIIRIRGYVFRVLQNTNMTFFPRISYVTIFDFQYQCHASKNKKDFAATETETGNPFVIVY